MTNSSRPWLYCLLPLFPRQFLTGRARQVKNFPAKHRAALTSQWMIPQAQEDHGKDITNPLPAAKHTADHLSKVSEGTRGRQKTRPKHIAPA